MGGRRLDVNHYILIIKGKQFRAYPPEEGGGGHPHHRRAQMAYDH